MLLFLMLILKLSLKEFTLQGIQDGEINERDIISRETAKASQYFKVNDLGPSCTDKLSTGQKVFALFKFL